MSRASICAKTALRVFVIQTGAVSNSYCFVVESPKVKVYSYAKGYQKENNFIKLATYKSIPVGRQVLCLFASLSLYVVKGLYVHGMEGFC